MTKDTLYLTKLCFLLYFCWMLDTIGRHVDVYQVHLLNLVIFIRISFFGICIFFFWGGWGGGGWGGILSIQILRKCSKHGINFNQHVIITSKPKLGVHDQTMLTLSLYGVITFKNRKEISESKNFTMLHNCGKVINYES